MARTRTRDALTVAVAAQGATLTPRIACAVSLLERACAELESMAGSASCARARPDGADHALVARVRSERSLLIAAGSTRGALELIRSAGGLHGLAVGLPVAISMVRAAGSQAHEPAPACALTLGEAAGTLGSVAIDAALMAGTRADYGACAREAARALEGAKLIVDSKLCKRYPKLDPAALGGAWA